MKRPFVVNVLNIFGVVTTILFWISETGTSLWFAELITPLHRYSFLFVTLLVFLVWKSRQIWRWYFLLNGILMGSTLVATHSFKEDQKDLNSSISLLNFNTYSQTHLPSSLFDFISSQDLDVLVFVEYVDSIESRTRLESLGFIHSSIHKDSRARGMGIWSRFPMRGRKIDFGGTGMVSLQVQWLHPKVPLEIVALHFEPPMTANAVYRRNKFAKELISSCQKFSRPLVLAGDFNATPWDELFARIIVDCDMKYQGGPLSQATWPSWLGYFGIPIDHVLVSNSLKINEIRIGPSFDSDHFSQIVSIGKRSD